MALKGDNVQELLSALRGKGMELWTQHGELHFRAPSGSVTADEICQLRALKQQIIQLLEIPGTPSWRGRSHSSNATYAHPPLTRREAGAAIPLTGTQLQLWHTLAEAGTSLYVDTCITATRVLGPLRVDMLRASIAEVVRRHESLRCTVMVSSGVPRQHVSSFDSCDVHMVDLSAFGWSRPAADREVRRQAQEFVDCKSDLRVGPLLRFLLLRISAAEHVLVAAINHFACDGISKQIVGRELWSVYGNYVRGEPCTLHEPRLQFPDYCVWQERAFATREQSLQSYWQERLGSAPRTRLPIGEAPAMSSEVAIQEFAFGHDLSAALRQCSRSCRTMLSTAVLTIFVAVMSRWCEQADLTVKVLSDGRFKPELQDMTGYLATVLYLRVELLQADTFVDLLKRVEQELYSALDHHDLDRVPLMLPNLHSDLFFNWLPDYSAWWPMLPEMRDAHGVRLERFDFVPRLPTPFLPYFAERDRDIIMTVVHQPATTPPSAVRRLADDVRNLARQLVSNPSGRPAEFRRGSTDRLSGDTDGE